MVLQRRQEPGSFQPQRETMGFSHKLPGHLEQHCPNVALNEIEWKFLENSKTIPYGLVRTFELGGDAEVYHSHVDANQIH